VVSSYFSRALSRALFCVSWIPLTLPCLVYAQQAESVWVSPQAGERLSVYLRRAGIVPSLLPYEQVDGLMLSRDALKAQQLVFKTQLKTDLWLHARDGFYTLFLESLPVTGRLILSSTDADFLSISPNLDPVIQPQDQVQLGKVSDGVLVLLDNGTCEAKYRPGATVRDYVRACVGLKSSAGVDTAWVVQPKGGVQEVRIGGWNTTASEAPQPGAWVLAPSRDSEITHDVFERYARFLATQGGYLSAAIANALPVSVEPGEPLRPLPLSSNDFGLVGLLQTPTARMREAGTATVTASRVSPYSRYSIILQPFDWLEGGLRYTKITNRLYGPVDFSGDQKYLDKNIDFKLRLMKESAYLPEVSLGIQDIGGTALFAGEYFVGNKRFGSFDISLGLGYGYLGRTEDVSNPLGLVSSRFKERPNRTVSIVDTGKVSGKDFFRGHPSVFGGVQWHTPWERWVAKVELEGNNYQREPLDNPQEQTSRLNYGLVYRLSDSVNIHLGVERGNTLSVGLSVFENFGKLNTPKLSDPKPLPVTTGPRPTQVDWKKTVSDVEKQSSLQISSVEQRGSEVKLGLRSSRMAYAEKTLDRMAEVLHRDLPEDVKWFTVEKKIGDAASDQLVVDRSQFVAKRTEYQEVSVGDRKDQVAVEGFNAPYQTMYEKPKDRLTNKTALSYRQILGGSDGLLYQFSLSNETTLNLSENTRVQGRLSYRLIDNFERFTQRADSKLPQVRTLLREYAITSDFTMPNLTFSHLGTVGRDHFYGVYGGYLEPMFAGVGAEYLYRPHNSWYAIGVDVNRVRQRAFEQDFSLLPYTVNTGHVTAYMDTGIQDIQLAVSAGQYLAGDKGVTVDVSREFKNGARMGAFVTKTNVSAADFGEGSFDKGIYLTVPFSAFFTKTIPGDAVFLWRPITRDGGAKLARGFSLYSETEMRNPRVLKRRAGGSGE
jgi:hypothetical protein